MRKRAIRAELRKESEAFDGWLKYEITVENQDGSKEKIPAYGKDLQDALKRVVHDERVKKVKPLVDKVPQELWVVLWFIGIGLITGTVLKHQEDIGDKVSILYLAAVVVFTSIALSIRKWFRLNNK